MCDRQIRTNTHTTPTPTYRRAALQGEEVEGGVPAEQQLQLLGLEELEGVSTAHLCGCMVLI
jgi:hypothetical protein